MITICLWDYIHCVRYHLKAYYFYFNWYIICYNCLSGTCAKWLYWMQCQKINVPKLHHFLKFSMMFCFGGFRYNEWARAQRVWVHALTKGKHEKRHSTHFPLNPINFATPSFCHCPEFTHPTHSSVKQSEQIRHQSKGK